MSRADDLYQLLVIRPRCGQELVEAGIGSRSMTTQASLFAPSIEWRFEAFHGRHPEVYDELVVLAYRAYGAGRRRIGIGMLFEVLRWEWTLAGLPDAAEQWKLNNNYRSRYARLIMVDHPQLDGLFEVRELQTP